MKTTSIISLLIMAVTTSAWAIENRTNELPWTDYPAHNAPTIESFCKNTINANQISWGKNTTVTCVMKDNGIIEITGRSTNSTGIERSLTISAGASHLMYMEESGDVIFKYKNDQGESLYLSTQFVNTNQKMTAFGVKQNGYYKGDLHLSQGEVKVRVGFTDLE